MKDWVDQCHLGDCIEVMRRMPDGIVQTCVTSPPYFGLRDYGHDGQIGLEATPDAYIAKLVEVFREVKRVLRDDGTLWLNIGDSYAANRGYQVPDGKVGDVGNSKGSKVPDGLKAKDLIGIPWMLAFALRADGWYLRQEIIWAKPNPMPESVTDRCTKSHESIFLLAKSEKYYFDAGAIAEQTDYPAGPGNKTHRHMDGAVYGLPEKASCQSGMLGIGPRETRNKRSVWTVATTPYSGAHFATFPPKLIEPCILAGAPAGGIVLDPFFGSGTTGQVAQALGRQYIGCELNPSYKGLQDQRTCQSSLELEAA